MNQSNTGTINRFLGWDACLNTRELGGYAVEGGSMRWQTLVRSDNTHQLSRAGQQAAIDYGINTVIDLRYSYELEQQPSPFMNPVDGDPDFYNISLDQDENILWPSDHKPAVLIGDLYQRMLESNRTYIASVLSCMAQAKPGGILFNCHAGKDRTGLVAAMVLGLLGASKETIVEDYALITGQIQQRREDTISGPSITADQRQYFSIVFSSHPESMQLTVDYLESHYGGIQGYLNTTPLTQAHKTALQHRLVEPNQSA